ncbi:MAG TPA: NADP-dependent oxidoreductase, partial [Candidatus Baltobacteraceae bacterium]|nr:NADP-dependent oxidoreductase [Candidatus Baltobacteraceae bacterium]
MAPPHRQDVIAVLVQRFGGPEELTVEDVSVPATRSGEALVRVYAAGVGPWDALVRSGNSGLPQTLPLTPGSDIAGIVERIDGDGSHVRIGDAVYGVTNSSFTGGYAEYAAASLTSLARKPERLSFIEAASVPVIAVTAWQMLFDRASVSQGQTVLVLGAAGNVGSYAVQIAEWAGARVVPISDSRRGFEKASGVDVVIDTVGGETQERSFETLKRGGMLVSSV